MSYRMGPDYIPPSLKLPLDRYNDLCAAVIERSKAAGAIVVVFDGSAGSGFSAIVPAYLGDRAPEILPSIAEQIEADIGAQTAGSKS